MAELLKQHWEPQISSGLSRKDRQGCAYAAYIPDPLKTREVVIDGDTAADVADAETAVTRLNVEARSLVNSEAVARLLLRAEAVASSKIEGLEVGARRLLKAQAAQVSGDDPSDVTATEVLKNIEAMSWAVEAMCGAKEITPADILGIHHRLLEGTQQEKHAGKLRHIQNWIGGSDFNPCTAAFVPPPPDRVPGLLEDLCSFCNSGALPSVIQAAIAHAQFETIHPFVDGNGRTGRALIHVILKRRGLAQKVLPPISLVLATWSADYVESLTATRYVGSWSSQDAHDGLNRWLALFAAATRRSVADAGEFEKRVDEVKRAWRSRVGVIRANSALDLLIEALPGAPIVTVRSGAALIDRSEQAVNEAIPRLLEADVLRQTTVGRRNRAFEAPDLLEVFTDLERQLASPEGDTRSSEPSRLVPHRQ